MEVIRAATEKLEAALALTERLSVGSFPYPHAEEVLGRIAEILQAAKRRLDPDAHPAVLQNECNLITSMLDEFLPLLGFLYRSRSSANAFELYGPLLRLVRSLVDGDSRLILASEWQFSPFTYVGVPGLGDVIWVGLPASESSNALLTPLAGHEFGHHVWAVSGLRSEFHSQTWDSLLDRIEADWASYRKRFPGAPTRVEDLLGDAFQVQRWSTPHQWALRQCEEVFCDLVGIRLFGRAYVYAFSYLLAPGSDHRGARYYPTLAKRIEFIRRGAEHWGYQFPDGYEEIWTTTHHADPTSDGAYMSDVTDDAVSELVGRLIKRVDELIPLADIPIVKSEQVDAVERSLAMLTPSSTGASLPAIINAGWRVYFKADTWNAYPAVQPRRHIVLNELLLKSAQVGEVTALLEDPA